MSMWEMLYIVSELLSWKHFIVRSFTDTRSNLKWLESCLMTILFTCWAKFVVTLRHLEIPWTCSYTVLQYTFVLFLSFLAIKNTQNQKKICRKLAELAGCLRLFSAVPIVSVPGNSALWAYLQTLLYCDGKIVIAFPKAALASWGLNLCTMMYHDVRGKDLFTCLLLSLLAAQFPASLFCYSESLCPFAQKMNHKRHSNNIKETISVWIRKRICCPQKSSGLHKVKSGGQSLQLWNSGFMLSQE